MFDWITGLFDGSLVNGGVFLIIGVIGAVLLLISLLLDGIFDFFDFGDGPLSLTTIAAFATIFGFTAFGLVGSGVSPPFSAFWGAVAGLSGGFIAWWLSKLMRNSESNTSVSTSDLKGEEAIVVLEIPGGGRVGEISLTVHGERIALTATSKNKISRGERVRIIDTLTATSVSVEKI